MSSKVFSGTTLMIPNMRPPLDHIVRYDPPRLPATGFFSACDSRNIYCVNLHEGPRSTNMRVESSLKFFSKNNYLRRETGNRQTLQVYNHIAIGRKICVEYGRKL